MGSGPSPSPRWEPTSAISTGDGRLAPRLLRTGYPSYDGLMPNALYHNRDESFHDVTIPAGVGHLQKGPRSGLRRPGRRRRPGPLRSLGGAFPGDGFKNALFLNPGFDHPHPRGRVGRGREQSQRDRRHHVIARFTDASGPRILHRWVGSGGSFGASSLRVVLGLADASELSQLEIEWPRTGKTQVFENVKADRVIRIRENSDEIEEVAVHRIDG